MEMESLGIGHQDRGGDQRAHASPNPMKIRPRIEQHHRPDHVAGLDQLRISGENDRTERTEDATSHENVDADHDHGHPGERDQPHPQHRIG